MTRTKEEVQTASVETGVIDSKKNDIHHLIELNRHHSELFCSPGITNERKFYRKEHPTEIGASKCMDGRLHLPVITNTAMGIIQPWRNIGGKFDLSWPLYQESILDWHRYATQIEGKPRRCLKLVTYHYSRGDKKRGCRGFGYDREKAQAFARTLKLQFDHDFGQTTLYAVQCGIETDLEALILHGENGEIVDVSELSLDSSVEDITTMLAKMYPRMHEKIVADFVPLVLGNLRHIAEVRASNRDLSVDADHKEWVLGYGRGFDWLHEINTALIVGPFDPNRSEVLQAAGGLILENLQNNLPDGQKIVLLSSAFYKEQTGPERNLKIRKALGLEEEGLLALRKGVPQLIPHLQILTGVVDINTREMEILNQVDSVS